MPSLSFVVLPFANPSGDANQDYIAMNITEDVTAALSRVPGSFVIARGSAVVLARDPFDIAEISRKTGVRFVIRGEASVQGEMLGVVVTMLSTDTGERIWTAKFEREFVQMPTLGHEITIQVTDALHVSLNGLKTKTPDPSTLSVAALDAVLRANAILERPQNAGTLLEARHLLEQALLAVPESVDAMVGLASIHLAFALRDPNDKAKEFEQSERLLQRALAVRPNDPRALSVLGTQRRATGDKRGALTAYRAAIAIDPNNASAHAQIGRLGIDIGEAEDALVSIERALRLSPLDPQKSLWFTFAGLAQLYRDEPSEARRWFQKSTEAKPEFVTALVFLGAAQELEGHNADGRQTISTARRTNPALSIRRVEQQFAPEADPAEHWRHIVDALRRVGLPD